MRSWLLPLATVLCLAATPARAALTIEITQSLAALKPVAVMPFAGTEVGENIGSIVRNDLARGGLLKMVGQNDLPAGLPLTGTVTDEAWLALPGDLLVRGSNVSDARNLVTFQYELLRRGEAAPLFAERFTVDSGRWRDAAHYISDRLHEKITGEKGVFSTRILYVNVYPRNDEPRYRLEMSDIDGARRTRLLDSNEPIMSATWSPDGREVAYVSFETGQPQVYTQHLQTRKRTRLTDFDGINGAPDWSPNGKQMVMTLSRDGNPEIYIMDLDNKGLRRLTTNPAIDTEPRWSRDGKSVTFTSDRSGRPQIYRIDLDSGETRRLTFEGRFNAKADPSPNSRYLALIHESGDGRYRLAVQDLQTRLLDVMTGNNLDDSPSFAPDSRLLVYATRQGGGSGLRIQSIDGRAQWRLPAVEGEIKSPAWSPLLR